MARPNTREGLISAVIAASKEGRRVKAAGSGHSFTGAALTEGTMVRLESLDRVLEVDRAAGLVKVEAGITLRALSRKLDGESDGPGETPGSRESVDRCEVVLEREI